MIFLFAQAIPPPQPTSTIVQGPPGSAAVAPPAPPPTVVQAPPPPPPTVQAGPPPPGAPVPLMVQAAPAPSPEEQERLAAKRNHFGAAFELGPTYRSIYSVSSWGGVGRVALGSQSEKLFLGGFGSLLLGSTNQGLGTYQIGFGFIAAFGVGSGFWLNVGMQVELLEIERVTTGKNMSGAGAGFFGGAQYDLVNFGKADEHAVFVGARLDATFFAGNHATGPFVWGPTVSLGVRL